MNLAKATGTIGGLTLISRVLGLVRDSLFARYVGANFASDAFQVAFRLPNMFRALFAEGAFNSAFIPMFNERVADPEGPGLPAGLNFAEQALSVLLPILLGMTVLLELLAWPLTEMLSGGFHGETAVRIAFAVRLARLTIPYLALISLVSLLGGILNSMHKFWVNAAAPILLNLTLISAMVFFHSQKYPWTTARNQAVAVTVSGALQLAWLWYSCVQNGVHLRLRKPVWNDDVKRLMKLIWPAAIGSGANQVNLVISTSLVGWLLTHGSITYIYNADRLNQLPLGLIGIGLGTVLLPTISRQLGGGDEAAAMETQNRGLELALLLSLPATVALVLCGEPIASALFGYGRFTAADSHQTALALATFSLSLPASILVKVLTPGFYARQDPKTPVRFGIIAVGVNLGLNLLLIYPLGVMGPGLATAFATTANVFMLYTTLVKRGHFVPDLRLKHRAWRLGVAALTMGAVLYISEDRLTPYLHAAWYVRYAALVVLVGAGSLVYGAATFALGAFTRDDLAFLRRRRAN